MAAVGSEVHSASNRKEYQKQKNNISGDRNEYQKQKDNVCGK
jgi:hypothetical protein